MTVPHDTVMVFDKELIDVGNNYNPNTGEYTAPVTGYYVFMVQLFAYPTPADKTPVRTVYSFMVDGQVKEHSCENNWHDYGAATASFIIKLANGAKVSVRNENGQTDFVGYTGLNKDHSWFIGYLLYEL